MGNFIPVEPEKWAEMVKAAAASDYWRIEAETDHARWLRTLEENEKLRAEVERLRASSFVTAVPVEQYERLVKAGDGMAEVIWLSGCVSGMEIKERAVKVWNATKEGRQS